MGKRISTKLLKDRYGKMLDDKIEAEFDKLNIGRMTDKMLKEISIINTLDILESLDINIDNKIDLSITYNFVLKKWKKKRQEKINSVVTDAIGDK